MHDVEGLYRLLPSASTCVHISGVGELSVIEKFVQTSCYQFLLLQIEIESKGKYVSSLLKLCACLEGNVTFRQPPFLKWDAERVQRVANNLQHRWHSLWLRSLERQYRIEELINKCKSGNNDTRHDLSFSEEPLKKYPRLSGEWDELLFQENDWNCQMDTTAAPGDDEVFDKEIGVKKCHKSVQHSNKREVGITCAVKSNIPQTNDKGIMVGPTTIAKMKADSNGRVGEFEIVQDVGYSSETSAHFSNDEPSETMNLQSTASIQSTVCCAKVPAADCNTTKPTVSELHQFSQEQITKPQTTPTSTAPRLYLPPDKYPTFNSKGWQFLSNDDLLCKLKHSQCSAVPDSFYKVTSVDSDTFDDAHETTLINDSDNRIDSVMEASSTATSNAKFNDSTGNCSPGGDQSIEDFSVKKPQPPVSYSNDSELESLNVSNSAVKLGKRIQKSLPSKAVSKSLPVNVKNRRCARVCEWLNTCHSGEDVLSDDGVESMECVRPDWSKKLFADSSCDASGEYTTTESDCERSAVSDDINNSLSLTQSFTGSVETVVPILAEEVEVVPINEDCTESAEPSPVVLRRKKRLNRDRPWSVTEVHQTSSPRTRFPHSTSEGALDRLVNSYPDARKTLLSCKKLSLEHTKSSLPDVTRSACFQRSRRTRSRGSLRCASQHSDTGSDGCLSFKKKHSFSNNKPSSLDSSQNSSATPLEQLPSSFTSASECTNDVLHSSSSARQRSNASTCSKGSGCSSHRKRRCRTIVQRVSEKSEQKYEQMVSDKVVESSRLASPSSSNCDHPTSNVEDHSSVSDQVWDEYQDPPYLSEPYSEQTVDEDQVQRLINFGDDYRTVLGSHSDASSINAEYYCRNLQGKSRFRSPLPQVDNGNQPGEVFDSASDSDTEDFHNILITSHRALQFIKSVYGSLKDDSSKNTSCSSEFAELIATCQTNLCHLHAIRDELDTGHDLTTLSNEDVAKLHDLIKEWEVLQVKLLNFPCKDMEPKQSTEEVQAAIIEVCDIMAVLKEKLNNMSNNALKALDTFSCLKELENKIMKLQMGLVTLQEMKETVLSANARIVRLYAEGGGPSIYPLRDNATKLYQQWEDVYELSGSQLTKLQTLRSGWKQSEENNINKEMETAVQWQPVQVGSSLPQSQISREIKLPVAGAEVLEPGQYDCVTEIGDQLDKMSAKCTVTEGDSENIELPLLHLFPPPLKFRTRKCSECNNASIAKEDSANSFRVKKTRSRLWRTVRAAVPIQVALVMLYCMACLLEPHCCDNINNLNFDFWPQLRYLHGPPPV